MNQVERISLLINEAMQLSDIFVKFHGLSTSNESVTLKEEHYNIILPFLFFNPNKFPSIPKSSHISFRLSYMQELFEASSNIIEDSFDKLPKLFEECEDPSQKVQFLLRDLHIIEYRENSKGNQSPYFLNLLQYSQYISDCLPILYAKFCSLFKLNTFISVAFAIGENAIKSFCFCFPNVILPVFQRMRTTADSLIINIATLSPNHRAILLPKLPQYPLIFSLLAIKFFKEEAPLIILSSIKGCYPEIKTELSKIPKNQKTGYTPAFFKLYARCCSALSVLDPSDYEILKQCRDNKLIIATLFNIEQTQNKFFAEFFKNFIQNPETMAFLFDLIYSRDGKNEEISHKIKNILGEDYDWQIKRSFSDFFYSNFKAIDIKIEYLGQDLNGLKIFSYLYEESDTNCSIHWFPSILLTLTKIDINGIRYLMTIINYIKGKKIEDFKQIIDTFVKEANEANIFDLLAISKNPAPSIAATIFILEAEKQIRHITSSYDISIINHLPLRFVVCCASHFEGCSSVFEILCKLCNFFASHVFYQSSYITLSPEYLLSKGNPELFLNALSDHIFQNDYNAVNEEICNEWMIHRFISPFQYSVDTIYALGGPLSIEQLHQVFDLKKEILRNKFLLKIICICLIDYVALYEKLYPHSDKEKNFNGSVVLILYSALDLLKDSLIDKKTMLDFLNDLFFISPWIFRSFVIQGCDPDLIYTITHGVNYLDTFWGVLQEISKIYGKVQSVLYFVLQFSSHLVDKNRSWRASTSCKEILKNAVSLKVNDENLSTVVNSILRIFRVFPDLYAYVDQLLKNINEKVKANSSNPNSLSILNLAFDEIAAYSISQKV